MSAPLAKQQFSLLQSPNASYGVSSVPQARGPSVFQRLADSLRWVAEYPRRLAVMDELHRLSDRELSDIGLTRSEVRSVFSRQSR